MTPMDNEPHVTVRDILCMRGRFMRAERDIHHHPDISLALSLYLGGSESQPILLILITKGSPADQSYL